MKKKKSISKSLQKSDTSTVITTLQKHFDSGFKSLVSEIKRLDKKIDFSVNRLDEKIDDSVKFLKNEIDTSFDALKYQTDEKFDELKNKIDFLPTKDEYYKTMDKLMGEIQPEREENIILSGKSSEHTDMLENHEERITKLEHLPQAV